MVLSWFRSVQAVISKHIISVTQKESEVVLKELYVPRFETSSQLVRISNKVQDQDKVWYVKRIKSDKPVRGGVSNALWNSWSSNTFVYMFGLTDPQNPNNCFFAKGDSSNNKVILTNSENSSSDFNGSQDCLFRHFYSSQAQVKKLQHVSSGKFVAINTNNKMILRQTEEDGDEVDIIFSD